MSFEFNEKSHRYTLDGKPLTGVTTVLGVIAKPALIQWAANMAVDYVEGAPLWAIGCEYKLDGKEYTITQVVLDEARKAHVRKKEEGGKKGTDIHKWIESWIGDKEPKLPEPEDEVAFKQIAEFLNWANKEKVEFLESEKRMYSEELWIGDKEPKLPSYVFYRNRSNKLFSVSLSYLYTRNYTNLK